MSFIFGNGSKRKSSSMPTMISAQTTVCGDISSSMCLDITGKVIGNIRCDCLMLREGGIIEGDIMANRVILDGVVIGSINARHVHLKKQAVIQGSLMYAEIITEQGARIIGQLTSGEDIQLIEKTREEMLANAD